MWKKSILSKLDVPSLELELYYWFPSILKVAPKQEVNITCRTHDEYQGPLPHQEKQQRNWEERQDSGSPGCLKGLQTTTTLQHEK